MHGQRPLPTESLVFSGSGVAVGGVEELVEHYKEKGVLHVGEVHDESRVAILQEEEEGGVHNVTHELHLHTDRQL